MIRIQVYDLKGNFVRTIGQKGNGPGEFLVPNTFYIGKNGSIYVHDVMRRRITVFSLSGSYKKDIILDKVLAGKFYIDKNEFIYTTMVEFDSENNMYIYLIKMDPEGKLCKVLKKQFYLSAVLEGKKRYFYEHPYLPNLYFVMINDNILACINSVNYELILLSKKGKNVLRIVKDEKNERVSRKEREAVFSNQLKRIPKILHKDITFSNIRPCCSNLLVDDKGRIYIERFKPITDQSMNYVYDIFNKKGDYLYKLELQFRAQILKNGYIFTTEENDETGEIRIISYKIDNWNKIKF